MKGRKISSPSGLALRPTPNKVREALFNILSGQIIGASMLDLYAGTGAIGIEALSRGAEHVSFVEQNRNHLEYIRKNLKTCLLTNKSSLFGITASDFLKRKTKSYHLVFLDPPYLGSQIEVLLPRLQEGDMISPSGSIVIEHFYKKKLPEEIGNIYLIKRYKYGETLLSFYGKK